MRYLLLFLLPCIALAQETAAEYANKVFEACKTNDVKKFEQFLATPEVIKIFVKQIDPSIPDETIPGAFESYRVDALEKFQAWQDAAKELGLDMSTVVITKTEAEEHTKELRREDKEISQVNVTDMRIYFNCSGKKLCFIISEAININGKYYLTEECVGLHLVN